ncbi:uncharacterized protein LOC122513166 [Polistes fuscatus]|uniref:uncharacterized protein LOC122513166 n=1 Tax=Polistes fuscatus TaxID=30207 RepID=UPI001CA93E73|nr:uncharacterized protein LOC122513166 [Polistes fuscatus]
MNCMPDVVNIGSFLIKRYDPATMDFFHWINQLEYIVDVVPIENNRKVTFLLGSLNQTAFSHIVQKVTPHNPYLLSYEVLVTNFEEFYAQNKGEWAANYRFILRDQFDGESVLHYIDALKKLACKVSAVSSNNQYLIRRFVEGLKDDYTKGVLRCKNYLTLDEAITFAAQIEFSHILSKEN